MASALEPALPRVTITYCLYTFLPRGRHYVKCVMQARNADGCSGLHT